ncbi:ABC transporter ATP-binding protein [Marinithermus hydrothermalis]|uniref:Taurine-transporting ATPase n=1 Tax=Marinithermus hydrothermalis (strain DSM 14884 / JCM 11576 / T1) TaxID=869210 RepID=F2NMU9_MARHT|nr:ABC transporter ATP-binding protein [Marinithermus hydrothermalis]AEB12483.1 Taurine-transporting ATPase [Marinithermus hydrothermalis DSM 14884]
MIQLERVTQTYGNLHALGPITLSTEAETFTALVGPSGCGKSTLLRLIAGLEPPSSGRITVGGLPVTGPSPQRILVFQEEALFPWLTLERNVAFGLEVCGVPKRAALEQARTWLDRVHLAGFEHYYPHQVSGGMRQRAALARALILNPQVLLLDEPFGALDALTRLKLQEELVTLWESRRPTVLLVTHDVEEALFLADRVVVLSPRPARILAEVPVPLPRPRARGAPRLAELKREILALLGVQTEVPHA